MKNDDFDWTLATGLTASDNTGPSRDHTFGTNEGRSQMLDFFTIDIDIGLDKQRIKRVLAGSDNLTEDIDIGGA